MSWISKALQDSFKDEKEFRQEALEKLRARYDKLQKWIDSMYIDKLEGRIDVEFFDRKAAEWRLEQESINRSIEKHQAADYNYMDSGVKILELARNAHILFKKQKSSEKQKLLNFLVLNSTWKDGKLQVQFQQPFDIIAFSNTAYQNEKSISTPKPAICSHFQ